jgi:glycosyltransferase involved in cell wall biosynthesis
VHDTVRLPVLRGAGGRRLRVAHLTTIDKSLEFLLGTELRADVEAGLDVFGLSAPGSWVERVEMLGLTHVPLPSLTRSWDLARDATAARELFRALRRLNLDVLHTHNPKTGVLGRLLGRVAGIPVVVNTCHGLWLRPGDGIARRAFVLGLESLAARASDVELYQNGEDLRMLRLAVSARRSQLVGNGIDLTRFRPDPQGRARIRGELGVADGEFLVGGVGRRVAEKGIAEFAGAARTLAGKARFVWVGPDDPDKPDSVGADEAGIEYLGERLDMPAIYGALDVFVLPSYREGFSRSAMEAAACAVASVLSDIRGCREIGANEREVLLVPPGDAAALTSAVERLLLDAPLRLRLASRARERALARFDQRAVARASLEAYAAVARRKGLNWQVEEAE